MVQQIGRLAIAFGPLTSWQLHIAMLEGLIRDLVEHVGDDVQRAFLLSSEFTIHQGAQAVSVAANISSRARE